MKAELKGIIKYLEGLEKQEYYGKVLLTYEKGSCYNIKLFASIDVEQVNAMAGEKDGES